MSETCQVSAKAQVGSESDEDRTEVFYSLSWAWQVVIKGSIKSYLLIVWPHIFYCNSFVWPCLSSFKWAASLWVPSTIDIFPANDVSPWSQHYFHTGWSSPTEGPQSVSVLQMVLDRMLVFFPHSQWTDKPCIARVIEPPLPGEICFFQWLLEKDHLACKFCLSLKICVRLRPWLWIWDCSLYLFHESENKLRQMKHY